MKSDNDRLRDRIKQLEEENELLKRDKNRVDELMVLYSSLIEDYKKINEGLRESKRGYDKARQETLLMKAKYKDQMDSLMDNIKSTINIIT